MAAAPTEAAALIGGAFDLPGIAARYQVFRSRWGGGDGTLPGGGDPLARQLLLHTEWLNLVRQDPHLPAEHLPEGWPAVACEELFRTLTGRIDGPAAQLAVELLDCVPVGTGAVGV